MLSGGNDEAAFSLSSSGQLSLTQTLDREAQGKYVLLVTATDSGTTAAGVWKPVTSVKCFESKKMISGKDTRLFSVMFLFTVPRSAVYV